jgi:hypothetical protein
MKHVIAFATIGACLLVLSGGAALATDPHKGAGGLTVQTGRPGSGGSGASCGTLSGGTAGGPPGQLAGGASGNGSNSPFALDILNINKAYAGAGAGKSASAGGAPASQYDVACFQATQHP